MIEQIKYVHTNIIAKDWKALAQFYVDVFHCEPLYPERDLSGEWVDKLTGIKGVRIQGIHLKLPGEGPTLEIFQYSQAGNNRDLPQLNSYGFGHIAFLVDDVEHYLKKLLEHGGSKLGEIVQREIDGVGTLTAVYARDPEGNIIEIQNWK